MHRHARLRPGSCAKFIKQIFLGFRSIFRFRTVNIHLVNQKANMFSMHASFLAMRKP